MRNMRRPGQIPCPDSSQGAGLKTSLLDYALSGAVISTLLALTLAIIWILSPWTRTVAGDYHVLIDLVLGLLAYGLLSAAALRRLLHWRPLPAGAHDMDSPIFTYWKLLTIVYRMGQAALHPVTPIFLRPVVEVLYGARIGRDVALGGTLDDPYMVEVGDGCVLGNASLVSGNYISGGVLVCGRVIIGRNVTIGANSVVFPEVEIGDGAIVAGGSYVISGTKIPAGEHWRGNPARKWIQPIAKPASLLSGDAQA
jgi:serine acetyltransferase